MKNKYINYVKYCICCGCKLKGKRYNFLNISIGKGYDCLKCNFFQDIDFFNKNISIRWSNATTNINILFDNNNCTIWNEKVINNIYLNSSFKENFYYVKKYLKRYIDNAIFE